MNALTPHQRKALNIQKSISLTANAGSGKTFVLAQRFLEIILSTSTPPNQVAAITFTDKASGELYKRISVELNKLLLTASDPELKHRIEKIRKQLVSAKISTIHSFCIDLLKEFPVEASLDANFSTINEHKAVELIDLSIESTLKESLRDSSKQLDVKLLIRLLGSMSRLATELSGLVSKRKNVLNLIDKYYSSDEKEVTDQLYKIFESNAKILFGDKLPETLTHLNIINNCVLEINPKNELAIEIKTALAKIKATDTEISQLIKLKDLGDKVLTKGGLVRTQGYLSAVSKDIVQNSIKIVEDFYTQINEIELTTNHKIIEIELSRHSFAIINVFQDVLSDYELKKSELGVLDFEDILLKTKTLLDNESVRKTLSGKYKYLLVDEYQDTNEIQYEIFLPLVDNLKRGNLFIVGDEKQGIYRFRDAELKVFSKTKTDICDLHGEESLLTLPDSFRMAPAICLFVNSLFRNLFKVTRSFFNEVSSSDLVCARSDDFPGKVEFLIATGEETCEAELTVKKIISLKSEFKDRLKEWNDIAILVRKRSSFIELQKAFIIYEIPFNLIGGTGFYQKQSISDINNYFAFLLNEKDDAALIGILRSPFFSVSDVKIFKLSKYEGGYYWEKIKSAASIEKDFWEQIFERLNEDRQLANRISIPSLLRKILRESDFISVLSSRNDGAQEMSNINKLISITNEFFNDEFSTLYDYVTFLRDAISGTEDESQGRINPGSIGVNILTIHQAKGLEYPAVFLYKCNDTTPLNKVKSKSFTVDKDFGLLTKVPLDENYFGDYASAPLVGLYNLIEEKKELAELKRLLYVGLTRAKDFLFITQTDDINMIKKNSFAAMVVEGLNQDLSTDMITLQGELTFLKKDKDKFVNVIKPIEIEIPIIRNIELSGNKIETAINEISNKKIILSKINDHSKGEVISATRFSTFSSCPMKYNLLYNYKIGNLIQRAKDFKQTNLQTTLEEYNRNELDSYLLDDQHNFREYSKVKGKIIHNALRKKISKGSISTFVEERLKYTFDVEVPQKLTEDITGDLLAFYDSEEFNFIKSFTKYRNEFEIYLEERDYYLFGILDKLIIDEKKLIIVDYKTDNIKETELNSRAGKYLPQLQFYAYIVSRLFTNRQDIEGRIIFIKYPEKPIVFKYDEDSDSKIKSGINFMIKSIRNSNYSVNLSACDDCIFADDSSKCLKINSAIN
jgi:ATP-dependent helicase/nuclease subunit A